jgi:broad specificity phosphatase PhoE
MSAALTLTTASTDRELAFVPAPQPVPAALRSAIALSPLLRVSGPLSIAMVNAPRQTIHLIRHAEALHNVADDWALPDPPLTDRGFAQARGMPREYAQLMVRPRLGKVYPRWTPLQDSCDLIVASPLRRTLQTTLFGLEPCIRRGVPVILLGELQECGANPCDTGSSLDVLRSEFGQHQAFSFHTVDEGWTSKRGKWSPSDAALAKRARWVRRWLKARPEANIAVVTHGVRRSMPFRPRSLTGLRSPF